MLLNFEIDHNRSSLWSA